jgi:hypothetical protein
MLGLVSAVVVSSFLLTGCGEEEAVKEIQRADVVWIDSMSEFGSLERPPVVFLHDLHTQTLEIKEKGCDTCHLTDKKGLLSPKFMRLKNEDKQSVMEIYHENCIDCHKGRAAAGLKSGPVTCGECHRVEPTSVSTWQPMGLDHSLHYRHIRASKEKCDQCHHEYDPKTKKLIYEKGKEASCRDCHRKETEENRNSMRLVSHWACVGCHQTKLSEKVDTGPVNCGGCHDSEKQRAIKKLDKVPRLARNQPDIALVGPPALDLPLSKMNTVPFDHKAHEGYATTCRVCHHESLKACKECHTLAGDEKGKGVTLERANHETKSNHSCLGCHERKKLEPSCVGCHGLLKQGSFAESTCQKCHGGPRPDDPIIEQTPKEDLSRFMPQDVQASLSFPEKEIPKEVTIKVLAKEYKPAVFPHRKIIDKLREHVGNSPLASRFHGHEDVVCMACHHHSPMGTRPPLCGSCHGRPPKQENLFMPGLLGAYHIQCMGCHLGMGLEKPASCTGCHAKATSGG